MNHRETLVSWSESYNLGLEAIDDQHKVLIDLLNRLWSGIVGRAGNGEMLTIVEELEKYTVSHFSAEEAFMRATNYEDAERHKRAHQEFVARIAAERANIAEGRMPSLDLLKFLKEWLVQHILVSDKAYADAYHRSREPESILGSFFKRFR